MKAFTAHDVMNPRVVTVSDDKTVEELVGLLMEQGISGAPVVDSKGKFVGVVSATDVMEERRAASREIQETGRIALRKEEALSRMSLDELGKLAIKGPDLLVRDIMTPTVYTVPHDLTVAEVARTMVAGRIHRLFVTRGPSIVGIITALDLLKLLYEEAPGRPSEL